MMGYTGKIMAGAAVERVVETREREPRPLEFAWLVPGQGSQVEKNGVSLLDTFPHIVGPIFAEASEYLDMDVEKICREATAMELKQTDNAQAVIGTVCLAAHAATVEVLKDNGFPTIPAIGAGISFGELAHGAIAGKYTRADYFYIVKHRGEIMHEVGKGIGAMLAVLKLNNREDILEVCKDTGVVAAIWYPGISVISGLHAQLEEAKGVFKERGGLVLPTGVEYPFHNPVMLPAEKLFGELLGTISFSDTCYPVVVNASGEVTSNGAYIKEQLPKQITRAVDGEKVLRRLGEKADIIIELCPKPTVSSMVKRAHPEVDIMSVYDADSLKALVEHLKEIALPSLDQARK